MNKKFLFAYGSLVNHFSRKKVIQNVSSFYGNLSAYKRIWCINVEAKKFTGLGLIYDKNHYCNGIYIPISEEDINRLDEREIKGSGNKYERILINNTLCDKRFKENEVYTYVSKVIENPSPNCPLIQSYIDVVIQGFIQYNKEYAKEFCQTTFKWNENYINDRNNPIYHKTNNIEKYYSAIENILYNTNLLHFRQKKRK